MGFSGLYHKLHGTHRPEAMKKSVIKRRKRVTAVGPSKQAEQAAAEALVAVGRASDGTIHGVPGNNITEGSTQEEAAKKVEASGSSARPKRKSFICFTAPRSLKHIESRRKRRGEPSATWSIH
jgi:GATA-binding protein